MADSQERDIMRMMDEFRMKALEKSESSIRSYHKAIASFASFVGTYFRVSDFPSESFLADWFLHMRIQGLTEKTALLYFDVIAALYRETEDNPNDNAYNVFRSVKSRIKSREKSSSFYGLNAQTLQRVRDITKNAPYLHGKTSVASDILLFSLLNRGMAVMDAAKLKTVDVASGDMEIDALVKRQSSPRRKYLFDLNQSRLTDKKLKVHVEVLIADFLSLRNIPLIQSVDNTIKAIWAYAALNCGISGSEVLSILGSAPYGITELGLCIPAEIDETKKRALAKTVIAPFVDNPLRWYAMKLRPRVNYDDVIGRIANLDDKINRPEFFYPYDEITKRVGKKLVHGKQPVIKDVVFFKLRVTDIFPLFCKIGDIAWCYTTTGKPGGDYAAIPQRSFEHFQETIGHFTPDYEIAAIGGFEPAEGETVVVLNGLLTNQEFDIEKIENRENAIFQLHMTGNNGIQWRTKAKRHQLKPALHRAAE